MRSGGLIEVADPSARFVGEATAARRARWSSARWRGPGRCSSRSRRWSRRPRSCRRGASRPASTATGSRWCSRCSPATAGRRSASPTSSSTSPAGSGSTSPAPTSRSRWRSPPPTAASRSPTPTGRPLACFGELGLTGELRYVAHADRRVAEALKFGLGPVLGPAAGERSRACAAGSTLRDALGRRALARAVAEAAERTERARARWTRLTSANSDLSTRNSAGRLASRAFCHHRG